MADDVDYYNRAHEMMHILTTNNNSDTEGFGYRWYSRDNYLNYDIAHLPGVASGASINACFKPLVGLFAQRKFIPLMWCPITLEFEIVSGSIDAVITPIAAGPAFTPTNTSTSWQIQDVRIIADVVTLDNGLQNSYAEHGLSGKSLPINYSTYVTFLQSCVFPSINVRVTRAVSRLKTVLFNFGGDHTTVTNSLTGIYKDWNNFQHPNARDVQL